MAALPVRCERRHARLREAVIEGASASDTTTLSPNAPNITALGARPDSDGFASFLPSASALAEVAFWDLTGFSVQDRSDLWAKVFAGESPIAIRNEAGQAWTGKLVAYYRLLDTDDLDDYSGNGHHLTMVGSLSNFGSGPPVDDPPSAAGPIVVVLPSATLELDAGRVVGVAHTLPTAAVDLAAEPLGVAVGEPIVIQLPTATLDFAAEELVVQATEPEPIVIELPVATLDLAAQDLGVQQGATEPIVIELPTAVLDLAARPLLGKGRNRTPVTAQWRETVGAAVEDE